MSVFGLALLASLLQAQETPPVRNPWDGFAPGSTVVRNILSDAGKVWMTTKEVLESRTETGLPLVRETTNRDSSTTNGDPTNGKPFAAGLREAYRRKETITIKGRKLDCDVITYTEAPDDPGNRRTVTVWHASEISLPPRRSCIAGVWSDIPATAVRIDSLMVRGAQRISATLEVLNLSSKQVVQGVAIDCVEEESRLLDTAPSRLGVVRGRHEWRSPQVPGALVRSERECGTTERTGRQTMELVEFKAVR